MDLSKFKNTFNTIQKGQQILNDKQYQGAYVQDSFDVTKDQLERLQNFDQHYVQPTYSQQESLQCVYLWKGKSEQLTVPDTYFISNVDKKFMQNYYELYIQSCQTKNKYSLFNQQLCYSVQKNICFITIDTDVYVPEDTDFIEDDNLLIQFLDNLRKLFAKYLTIEQNGVKYFLKENHPLFDYIITTRQNYDTNEKYHQTKKVNDNAKQIKTNISVKANASNSSSNVNKNILNYATSSDESESESESNLHGSSDIGHLSSENSSDENENVNKSIITQNKNYRRYGYHTYFYNLVLSQQSKKLLYQKVYKDILQNKSLIQSLQDRYHDTFDLQEYFDKGPFCGTSSLPFSSGKQSSIYKYIINPLTKKRIDHTSKQFQQYFTLLNPFKGITSIPISYYIQQEKTLLSTLQNPNTCICNYNSSVYYLDDMVIKQIYNDNTMNWLYENIIKRHHHIPWNYRNDFVKHMFNITQDRYMTQIYYYIAMCEQIVDQVTQENDDYILNTERDRYPVKCYQFVQKCFQEIEEETTQKKFTKLDSIQFLIDQLNKRILDAEDDGEILGELITQNPFTLYGQFEDFFKKSNNGVWADYPMEQLQPKTIQALFNQFIYQYKLKDIKFVRQSDKKDEYLLYQYNSNPKNGDTGHYVEIDSQYLLASLKQFYNKLQDDYSLLISKTRYNYTQLDLGAQQEKKKSQQNFLEYLIQSGSQLNAKDKQSFILSLVNISPSIEPNTRLLSIGVYNGILEYDPETLNFSKLSEEECIKTFQTQTTLFKIHDEFLDKDNNLISEETFLNSTDPKFDIFKITYKKIIQILNDIFGNQIDVFYWKVSMIMYQIIADVANQFLLTEYGTGGDGKSMNNEALQFILGLCSDCQEHNFGIETRKIQNFGYSSTAKATVLATDEKTSSQHDSGGMSELLNARFGQFAELSAKLELSSATIKKMASGTSVQARRAYATKTTSMIIKAFLVLQTNNYPKFNQALDDGVKRRFVFYRYPNKFVTQQEYDKYSVEQRKQLRIKDTQLQDIFMKNVNMVDMLGLHILYIFINSQRNNKQLQIPIIPEIIHQQTEEFFNTLDIDYNNFINNYLKQQSVVEITEEVQQILQYNTLYQEIRAFCIENKNNQPIDDRISNIITQFNADNKKNIIVFYKDKIVHDVAFNNFNQYTRDNKYQVFYKNWSVVSENVANNDYKIYQKLYM